MKKIIFISVHRKNRSPSQRFRFEQYLNFLSNHFFIEHFFLVSEKEDELLYSNGNFLKKMFLLLKYVFKLKKLVNKINDFDICYVQRECIFIWSYYFERKISKKIKLIYDFDDSIFLPNVSENNRKFSFLKGYNKVKKIISVSDLIFAGNGYLLNYAKQFNNNIKIIPTTIDTELYINSNEKNNEKITIGWSGSVTTIQHFEYALPFLKKVYLKYKDILEFKVIGDGFFFNKDLDIHGIPWVKETEIKDLSSFDIGIMPLPNDEWANGKCGLKGLQYMALGIATVMSPVGVNNEIIEDGINGFLASNENEWIDKISILIESKQLRINLGKNARITVIEKYSFDAWKEKYLEYFNELIYEKNSIK